ncbi:hypothetical protein [Synechococcus sp. PCC 6312]|uniref:hypothetical protein n=1 Tax=Synechococcus sp. (strain ATCC 27167 / PCC 6312) TaxID=195253 RepID=UPI00029F2520|nr:hypothetical protein [Synechococcus sp. PCC 6312]AFY59697.1 hypothetical protein Syn6312_0469 [Synechococcus sp. PCC 6312]
MVDLPSLFQAIDRAMDRAIDSRSSRYGRLLIWQNGDHPLAQQRLSDSCRCLWKRKHPYLFKAKTFDL